MSVADEILALEEQQRRQPTTADSILAEPRWFAAPAPAATTAVTLPKKPLLLQETELRAGDPQRSANALEATLSALAIMPSLQVGTIRAGLGQGTLPDMLRRAVSEHQGYGTLLRETGFGGVPTPITLPGGVRFTMPAGMAAGGLGLAADIGLDPTTYMGVGALTKLGAARKAASLGRMTAELGAAGGDVARATGKALQVGELAPTMGAQARAGERALVSFAGKPVIRGAPVLDVASQILEGVKELSKPLRVAPELKGLEREAFLAREAQVRSARRIGEQRAIRTLAPIATEIRALARQHGVNEEPLREAMGRALELSKVPANFPVLEHLDAADGAKYRRWVMQGNAAKFGFDVAQPEVSAALDIAGGPQVRRMGGPPGGFPGPEKRLVSMAEPTLSQRELASAGTAGRPSIFITQRGNVQTTGGLPNVLGREGSFTGSGRMPEDMLALLPENTRKRIRVMEDKAFYGAQLKTMDATLGAQMSVFGEDFAKQVHGPARQAIVTINAQNAINLARRQAEGIPIEALADNIEYLRRITTPEAQRIINREHPGGFSAFAREITERHGAQRQRTLLGMTTTEANELWQTGQMALSGYKPTASKLFLDDPFLATVRATGEAERAIEAARMLTDYARTIGKPIRQAPPGWLEVGSDLPALQGVRFPPEVARTLTKHFAPSTKTEFMRAWKTLNGAWARSVTGIFPGYHTRNEVGDVWNGIVLSGANPIHYGEAIPVLLGRSMSQPVRLGSYHFTRQSLWELADRLNVVNSGFVAELRSGAGVLSRPQGIAEHIDQNAAMRLAQSVGQGRENSTRLVLFMDGLAKGMEPAVAAERTRTFLFDYGRLPDAVSALRSYAMPFLAWTYYNAPLQAASLFRKPGAFTAVQKTREAAAGAEPLGLPEQTPLPRHLRSRLPIRMGTSPEGHPQFMALEGFWPGADLGALTPKGAARRAENILTPLLTAPIQSLKNYDTFRQQPLAPGYAAAPGVVPWYAETTPFLGMNIPSRLMPEVGMIRALTEANRLIGTGPPPRPSLGTRLMQFGTGARLYPVDVEQQQGRAMGQARGSIEELRSLMRMYERRGQTANAERMREAIEAMIERPEKAAQ